jgi:hypothetical protein
MEVGNIIADVLTQLKTIDWCVDGNFLNLNIFTTSFQIQKLLYTFG